MSNNPTEYSLQELKNLSADTSVSPVIPREGVMGQDSGGVYRNISVNTDGEIIVDPTALDSRYVALAPTTTTRNTVLVATATAKGLVLKTSDDNTTNRLFQVASSADVEMAYIDALGQMVLISKSTTTRPLQIFANASQTTGSTSGFVRVMDSLGTAPGFFTILGNGRILMSSNGNSASISLPVQESLLNIHKRANNVATIHRGIWAAVEDDSTTTAASRIDGLNAFAYKSGSTNLALAIAGNYAIRPVLNGSGTITLAEAIDASISYQGTTPTVAMTRADVIAAYFSNVRGTITTANHLYFYAPTKAGSGAITNLYGIYMEDMSLGSTLNFAIVTNAGNIVFNEGGDANTDVRIEGDTDANLFFTDASADAIGIGTNAPGARLHIVNDTTTDIALIVKGAASQSANLFEAQNSSSTKYFQIQSDGKVLIAPNGDTGGILPVQQSALNVIKNTGEEVDIHRGIWSAVNYNATSASPTRIDGLNAFANYAGTTTLTTANGGVYAVRPTGVAGTITVAQAIEASINYLDGATTNIDFAVAYNAFGLNIGGTIKNFWFYSGGGPTFSGAGTIEKLYGLYLGDCHQGTVLSYSIITHAGNVVFNEGSHNDTDFRVEGATDTSLLHTDGSADTVQVGAATTSDSAKFYVAGKISTSGEMEINGDLNHDGTNIGFFGVAPTTRQTELTDELTTITHSAPGTPDYAIAAPVDSSGGAAFGFSTADEFNTVMSVIANLQTRNKELEDKLTAYGLLQDAD